MLSCSPFLPSGLRDVADRPHAVLAQRGLRRFPDEQQRPRVERPDDLPEVFPRDLGHGVRLAVIAAELRKDLVERHAHRNREPELLPDAQADLLRDLAPAAEQARAAGDVEPALVEAEALHHVGVLRVNAFCKPRILRVTVEMRRHKADARALALGLPERFGRLHALRLRQHVFREHDAVPALAVAADGHRHIPQRRVVQRLDRRVEIVHIDVQDDAVHSSSSPGNFIRNTCCEYLFVFL